MNNIENILDAINTLIENGDFLGAKELAENITSRVDKLNTLGVIFHQEKNDDKALELLQQALLIEPSHDDALYNYAILLLEKGDSFESWRYLTRIRNKTWDVYNTLGDAQLQEENPIMALYYYQKASALSGLAEIKDKYDHTKNQYKKSVKLAIFCLPGLDSFITDIAEILSNLYDVKLLVTTDNKQIAETYNWADIVWLEWANELAIEITNKLPKNGKKVICRLHSYESLSSYPEKINWGTVDRLILVAEHIRDVLQIYHSKAYNQVKDKISIIPNGLDLTKFVFKTRQPGYNFAVVAHINHKKDPASWLQVVAKLNKIDKRYNLHIAGEFQDIRYANYFRHFIKDAHLEKNIELLGFINDVNGFLEDKNYLLSTSIHEGHPYNIAEAMARGIKPVIHNYVGSKNQWPEECIYNYIDEIPHIVEGSYDSQLYRGFVEANFSNEKQLQMIGELLQHV